MNGLISHKGTKTQRRMKKRISAVRRQTKAELREERAGLLVKLADVNARLVELNWKIAAMRRLAARGNDYPTEARRHKEFEKTFP